MIVRTFGISENNICRKWFGIFLNYLRFPVVSKNKDKCFWDSGTRPKISKSGNEGVLVSPISKPKNYRLKMKQNNTTELLSISFPLIYNTNDPTMAVTFPIFFQWFPDDCPMNKHDIVSLSPGYSKSWEFSPDSQIHTNEPFKKRSGQKKTPILYPETTRKI